MSLPPWPCPVVRGRVRGRVRNGVRVRVRVRIGVRVRVRLRVKVRVRYTRHLPSGALILANVARVQSVARL